MASPRRLKDVFMITRTPVRLPNSSINLQYSGLTSFSTVCGREKREHFLPDFVHRAAGCAICARCAAMISSRIASNPRVIFQCG
jgi:hypothetical protein